MYKCIPEVFYRVYSILLDLGYYSLYWKEAIDTILKKSNKPNYTSPKVYRVISLLNCLDKINKRILAQRLGYLAETTTLLDFN